MKLSLPVVVASLLALTTAIILVVFVRIPVSSLWRGYNVLYVPVEIDEERVLQVLDDMGVQDVITLSTQQQPLYSPYAPVQSIVSAERSYLKQRENYFFDRAMQMRLFYVQNDYMNEAFDAVKVIQNFPGGEKSGLEGKASYPWIVIFVVVVVFFVFVFLSKAKIFVLVSGFFPLLFTICIPSYSGAGAVVMLLYTFFLCSTLWQRKKMFKAVLQSSLILLFGISSVIIACIGSWKEGLLLILTLTASLSLCYLLSQFLPVKKRGFMPIPIRSAQLVSVVSSVTSFTLFIPAVAATILFVALFFFGYFPAYSSINGLFLPAPARYTDTASFDAMSFQDNVQVAYFGEELPSLVHYVDWVWDTLTYPYRSLHETEVLELVSLGETVFLPYYRENQEGVIEEEPTAVYSLDEAFISAVMEGIRDDSFQIEEVLKNQNCFTSVIYRRMGDFLSGGFQGQIFIVLSLLSTVAISLVAGIFIWRIQK